MLCLVVALLVLPAQRPPDAVDRAAAAARVGDGAKAIALLKGISIAPADRASVALVRARAYLSLGKLPLANIALTTYQQARTPLLEPIAAELRLEAAWLRPAWDPMRPHAVISAADAVPESAPERLKRQAAWRAATIEARLPDRHAQALRRLADLRTPAALALRAELEEGEARARAIRRLVVEHPASRPGRALADRAASLSPADRLNRARRLFSARAYDLADAAWAEVARAAKDPAIRQEATLVRGTMHLRLFRDPQPAVRWLAEAARGPDRARAAEALFRQGIALGRLKQWDAAIVAMRAAVARHPKGRFATGAAYQVGRLMHEAGRFEQAARQTARFLKKKRRDPAKYRWFEGWSWLRAKRYAKARRVFARLADNDNLLVGPKALYWTARSYEMQGKKSKAIKTLRTLRRVAPWSYYGVLGDTLWQRLDPKGYRPLTRPKALQRAPQIPDLRPWPALMPIRQLARTGAPGLGDFKLPSRGKARATALHARERFGLHWKADADRRLPWRTELSTNRPDAVHTAYPPAWLLLAEAAGRPHRVSPWWLLAHMLQESRFKARARSHAGALGPMQVLPRTGRRIAARLGVPRGDFTQAQLYTPGIALRHAAWYLGSLRAEFGGSLLLAIAAYNGGPLRFAEHVKIYGDLPFDMLIEEIGAHESRNYVRKVADHLVRFALIYGSDAEFLGLIDAIRPLDRVPQAKGEVRF